MIEATPVPSENTDRLIRRQNTIEPLQTREEFRATVMITRAGGPGTVTPHAWLFEWIGSRFLAIWWPQLA